MIHVENNYFNFTELKIGNVVVPFPFILEKFKAYHRVPIFKRFPQVVKDIQDYVRDNVRRKLNGHEKAQIWQAVPGMFKLQNTFDAYRDFYSWMKKDGMFRMQGGTLEYADVFPLIYLKIRLEGVQAYDHIKHLLVDEMQDYTPVQYAVLSRLFRCKKTILGDVSQKVNPYSASSAEGIHQVFPQGDTVTLYRSYRSTIEITSFAQRLYHNPDLIPLERHGESPEVINCDTNQDEVEQVRNLLTAFKRSGYQSLGVICKTLEQARFVYDQIKGEHIYLLTDESTAFKHGVIVTTAHLSKGLEFDEVIVPFVSSRNYLTEVDKRMLYIACTRAMHRLTLTYTTDRTDFLAE
jgi:DNA helicase-2/ATP-dependent DNA helicase PcrA